MVSALSRSMAGIVRRRYRQGRAIAQRRHRSLGRCRAGGQVIGTADGRLAEQWPLRGGFCAGQPHHGQPAQHQGQAGPLPDPDISFAVARFGRTRRHRNQVRTDDGRRASSRRNTVQSAHDAGRGTLQQQKTGFISADPATSHRHVPGCPTASFCRRAMDDDGRRAPAGRPGEKGHRPVTTHRTGHQGARSLQSHPGFPEHVCPRLLAIGRLLECKNFGTGQSGIGQPERD